MMLGRGTRWWEKKEEEVDGEEEEKEQRNNEGEVGMGKREEEEKGNLVSVQSVSCCSLLTAHSSLLSPRAPSVPAGLSSRL